MNTPYFIEFDDDVEIKGISNFFRPLSKNDWKVGLFLSPRQEKDFLTLSNASQIVRGHILNPVNKQDKERWKRSFRIRDARLWETRPLGECPLPHYEVRANYQQYCFVFPIDDGITVCLPHFELARTLFFHGGYLSRTALESESLKAEFSIEIDEEDNVLIKVMDLANFPYSQLNYPKIRNYLSWLLLDEHARRSYESITKYQRINGQDSKTYRRWDFQFNPPPLQGVDLHVRGQFFGDSRTLFVYQIDHIKRIPNKKHRSISIWHSKLENPISGEGHIVQPAKGTNDEPISIYDDVPPNGGMQPTSIEGNMVSIEFKNPFYVRKNATKRKVRKATRMGKENESGLTSVSTEEGVEGKGLSPADWDSVQDNVEKPLMGKFKCFMEMVHILTNEYGCTLLEDKLTYLQQVGKSEKHLMVNSTGSRTENRKVAIMGLKVRGKIVHILEVDTSDAEQSLSTQILLVKDLATWEAKLNILKVELVSSSLRWPRKVLTDICGEGGHKGVSHPRAPSENKGVLDPESIVGWASRIHDAILAL